MLPPLAVRKRDTSPNGAVIGPVRKALATVEPDEISAEVALGVKGEVGFFVAKSEGSASLKVTAKWKPRESSKS